MSATNSIIKKSIISADSHVMEPPGTYIDRIDRKYLDRAPHVVFTQERGDTYMIDGISDTVPMGLIASAGKTAEELGQAAVKARFEDLHRGGWDPVARISDQDRDGIYAEVIYPSVGMLLCNHPDADYKKACFDAYNLWIAEFCDSNRERLLGCGQTTMRSPKEGIEDLRRIKQMGLLGVMMPGFPEMEDYDSPI